MNWLDFVPFLLITIQNQNLWCSRQNILKGEIELKASPHVADTEQAGP